MAKQFVCKVCGYVHTGDHAPDVCPQCQQSNCFEPKKKGLSTDSNIYTITYATILVVIVAVLLAVVSQVMKPRQEANALLDTQKQILVALNQDIDNCDDPAALYNSLVRDTLYLVMHRGEPLINLDELDALPTFEEQHRYAAEHGAPTVYFADVQGELKMILPLKGQGLWGAIWGYMALNDDLNTIYGINFGNEGETPGLGAEIVTENFRSRFFGKHIKDADGALRSVAVLKEGKAADEGQEQVDAWAGATITSTGVNDMLANTLELYYDALVGDMAMDKVNELKAKYYGIPVEDSTLVLEEEIVEPIEIEEEK